MAGRNLGGGARLIPGRGGGGGRFAMGSGAGASTATFGGGGGAGGSGPGGNGIFQPVVDAAHDVAARFNTEGALSAVNVADTAGDAVESLGRAFAQVGNRAADEIAWEAGSSEFFTTFGQHLVDAAAVIRDLGAQVRRLEEERIRRIEERDPRERAWDIAANE